MNAIAQKKLVSLLNSKKEEAFRCHRCSEINCLNLFDHRNKYKNVGGELYIYKLLGKKMKEKYGELNKYVCKNGRLLNILCFLVTPIAGLEEKSYLKDVLYQSSKDLKASIFLAFSGHYRQAMQVLRCSFENLISGIYFHSELCELRKGNATTEDLARLERRVNEWKKTGRVNIQSNIELLRRIGFLSQNDEKNWKGLYEKLSRFIHTPTEYVFFKIREDVARADITMTCLSTTLFHEDSLQAWSNSFQDVFIAILKTIVEYHSFALSTKSGKIAVNMLRSTENYFGIQENTLYLSYKQLVLPHLS